MKQHPSQLKYKKYHKPKGSFFFLKDHKSFFNLFEYGLKFIEPGRVKFSQLEACRKVIKRGVKNGFFNIDIFCYHPITGKAVASRMGKGKGTFRYWVRIVKCGSVACGISGVHSYIALNLLNSLKSKLPIKSYVYKSVY
jgi:ribosomal protein L16